MKEITQFCILAILILVIVGVSAEALNVNRTIPFNTTKVNTSVKPSNSTPVNDSVTEVNNTTVKPQEEAVENITEEEILEETPVENITPPEKTYEEKLEEVQLNGGDEVETPVEDEEIPILEPTPEEVVTEAPEKPVKSMGSVNSRNTSKDVKAYYTEPKSGSSSELKTVTFPMTRKVDKSGSVYIGKKYIGQEVEINLK